jgi:hypothetical protein
VTPDELAAKAKALDAALKSGNINPEDLRAVQSAIKQLFPSGPPEPTHFVYTFYRAEDFHWLVRVDPMWDVHVSHALGGFMLDEFRKRGRESFYAIVDLEAATYNLVLGFRSDMGRAEKIWRKHRQKMMRDEVGPQGHAPLAPHKPGFMPKWTGGRGLGPR